MALLQIQEPISSPSKQDESEIVIGIDLGTTNSLVGYFENNQLKLFTDENGKDLISSKVAFDKDGNFLQAGNLAVGDIEITSIKRLMGKNFSDINKINFKNNFIKNLIIDNSQNNQAIALKIGKKTITAIEISAEILKYLKFLAEKNLQQKITKAVITVPAYFDETAKVATKLSAQIAGLEVLRLVNEPTAGALAYGLDNLSKGTFLVYDFGGGTFDCSILKMQNGVFKVLGVAGDNELGGDDIDKILQDNGFKTAKEIKEELSFRSQSHGLSLSKFNYLINELIEKTIKISVNLLDDLELEPSHIDGVILVGGSTRIPLIKEKLSAIFGENKILTNLDPDRVVAIGACYQAHNLSKTNNNLLLDVNPLSLGIEMMGGIVDKIIYRNSTIPIAKTKEFTTYTDNQTAIKFHVVQGEREFAKDCRSLAEFEVCNIPPLPAGFARVKITFALDADGLLTISSEEKYTEQKQEIIVKPSFGLAENEIKDLLLESLKNSKFDMANRLLAQAIVDAKHDIEIIENDLKNPDIILNEDEKNKIINDLKNLKNLCPNNLQENLLSFKNLEQNNIENNNLENEISAKRQEILAIHQQLTKTCEPLILQKVNKVLKNNIAGKKIDEV